jgi:hypothetical protein
VPAIGLLARIDSAQPRTARPVGTAPSRIRMRRRRRRNERVRGEVRK